MSNQYQISAIIPILHKTVTGLTGSGLEGSPSHLMQPETVKLPELWFLRMVSTGVDVIGASGWNGNWMECDGAS